MGVDRKCVWMWIGYTGECGYICMYNVFVYVDNCMQKRVSKHACMCKCLFICMHVYLCVTMSMHIGTCMFVQTKQ